MNGIKYLFKYIYKGSDRARVELERSEQLPSTLIAWFELNENDPEARQYKYTDIHPLQMVFS